MHYRNGRWQRETTAPDLPTLYSVFMVSADEGWAVGGNGERAVILHYDGSQWNDLLAPTTLSPY
jgi:hypothetical protein